MFPAVAAHPESEGSQVRPVKQLRVPNVQGDLTIHTRREGMADHT
jgi:hypothetical protein